MVKRYEDTHIKAIADAIRAKNGTEETYKTSEMASAIEGISSGIKCVRSTAACGLTYANGVMTITGVEVANLKHLTLHIKYNVGVTDTKIRYIAFDFDIEHGKCDYECIWYNTGAYAQRMNEQSATITTDEQSNTITINITLDAAGITNSTLGEVAGWYSKAFYEK